ncbi:hypothetical protein [Kitasatospora sp. LaBMicrA B282]
MSGEALPNEDLDAAQQAQEQEEQDYFEQLAAVKDSILEGVITPW